MWKIYSELLVLNDLVKGNRLFLVRVQEILLIVHHHYHFMRRPIAQYIW